MFCGVDLGKGGHHVCALNRSGSKLISRAVRNGETAAGFAELAGHGRVQVVVNQVSGIAALTLAGAATWASQ